MIRIVLADDHAVLRGWVKKFLSRDPEMAIVGEASNGHEACQLVRKLKPDMAILDIGMPILNGLEATKKIKEEFPDIKVFILTQHESMEYLFEVLRAGGEGYVLKDSASSELTWAIKSVHEGKAYLSPVMTKAMIEFGFPNRTRVEEVDVLSARQKEVLILLADGYSNQEVADKLSLSVKTVQTHRNNIMERLELRNRTELVKYAIRKGLTHA